MLYTPFDNDHMPPLDIGHDATRRPAHETRLIPNEPDSHAAAAAAWDGREGPHETTSGTLLHHSLLCNIKYT